MDAAVTTFNIVKLLRNFIIIKMESMDWEVEDDASLVNINMDQLRDTDLVTVSWIDA